MQISRRVEDARDVRVDHPTSINLHAFSAARTILKHTLQEGKWYLCTSVTNRSVNQMYRVCDKRQKGDCYNNRNNTAVKLKIHEESHP
jgi:hypothetical protein